MSGLLLDTHALLWWLWDDPQLSVPARQAIANPDSRVWVSAASVWEIATKSRIGKLPELGDVAQRLPEYLRAARFSPLDISLGHAWDAGQLPGPHCDPFDRMLIAQALAEKLTVVTRDGVFADYGARVIW